MLLTVFSALNAAAILVGLVAAVRKPRWWTRLGLRWFDVIICGAIGFLPLVSYSLASPPA